MGESVRCLVTGATGYIGARLVPRLLDEGHRVRALARNPDKLADVPWRGRAEVVRGDLGDLDSLVAAFDDVDVVYYLVHSMGVSKDFAAEEGRAVRNVVAAAHRAGVRRVVYLSGLHPEGVRLSAHLESRAAVGAVLIDSGIETVVLQAGVVIGAGSASFELIRHLTDRLPVMTTPKWVHNRIQPIAVRDVLHYLVAAATARVPMEEKSRTWDIGGPDVLEYGDMMRVYAQVAGLGKRYLVVLPFLTPTIASLWVGAVTPIPPGLARPLIESLECDAVMRNADIDSIIDPPPGGLTPYRRAVELALDRAARGIDAATWASLRSDPAEPLPTDPDWTGETRLATVRTTEATAEPGDVWRAVEDSVARRRLRKGWSVAEREPGTRLLLRAGRRPVGERWLDITVVPRDGGGSELTQRTILLPAGLVGLLYWALSRPSRSRALRALARDVAAPVKHRTAGAGRAP
ncbi:nucleoside-diphosphate sugar epimerase [Mycobacterium alsense]|uniref:DUF2867 domain-containing protein n=1 Tax=Mycobacterium alsense TaxID=324058 RepID=UPI0007FBBCCE|nr:DUF2867 domain-containing protein [Mycobacterium alsense]OBI94838.1 nucleoside-diphosphate sugar epimerase [Mycobacterium alsense]